MPFGVQYEVCQTATNDWHNRPAIVIAQHFPSVVFKDRVLLDNIGEVFQHRLGGHGLAANAKMPLQIANP